MLYEWKPPGPGNGNLGDALTSILADSVPFGSKRQMISDQKNMFFLIGSVICDELMLDCLEQGLRPVFLNCGWRGSALSKELVSQSLFFGSRGPITQAALREVGVEVDITGDSAYALKGRPISHSLFSKPKGVLVFPHVSSIDGLTSPARILDEYDLKEKITQIAEAEFVLGGAMHAAILAHHFGVPFAPYVARDNFVDTPIKWIDWLTQIGLAEQDIYFSNSIEEGKSWYASVESKIKAPKRVRFPNSKALGVSFKD
jgi:hypothetical protein